MSVSIKLPGGDHRVVAAGTTVQGDVSVKLPPDEPLPKLRPLQVLLAEDSLVNQKLAVALLEKQGHHVTVVDNGREAMAATASGQFDLVLMDVQMPDMDGLEATEGIRAREKQTGTHIPIIAMTAHALKGDRERCLASGMDEYVSKPIRANTLLRAMGSLLGESAAAEQPEETVAGK